MVRRLVTVSSTRVSAGSAGPLNAGSGTAIPLYDEGTRRNRFGTTTSADNWSCAGISVEESKALAVSATLDPNDWMALRRVSDGDVTKLGGQWPPGARLYR
jgi:hypothetical protein